jgi:hypothetical protein
VNSNEATCVCVVRACRTLERLFARQLLDEDTSGPQVPCQKRETYGDPSIMIGLNKSRRLPVNTHLEQGLAFLGHVEIGDRSLERLGRHADCL